MLLRAALIAPLFTFSTLAENRTYAIRWAGFSVMKTSESPTGIVSSTWTTHRIILGTLVVLFVMVGFLLLYRFRDVVVIIFSGIVISIAITPNVNWLDKRGLPRWLSVILIYLVLLTLIVAFVILLVPPIAEQFTTIVPKIENYYQEWEADLMNSPLLALRQIALRLPSQLDLMPSVGGSASGDDSLDAVGQVLNFLDNILGGLFTLTAILLIGFYWTLEGAVAQRALLLYLPNDRRESVREILHKIEVSVGGYVRGQGINVLIVFVADYLIYQMIGLPAALSVALLAGLFEIVPVLGSTLGVIPAILVAFSFDPSKVVWVIVAGVLVQFIQGNFLAPRVMRKMIGVNPIVTLLALITFGTLFGSIGMLLAIPMAAIIQIILDHSLLRPQGSMLEVPLGRNQLSKLRFDVQEFVVDVRNLSYHKQTGTIESEADPVEDALEGIAIELDRLLSRIASLDDEL